MTPEEITRTIELGKKLGELVRSKPVKKDEKEELANDVLYFQAEFFSYLIKSEVAYRLKIRTIQLEIKEGNKTISFASAENLARTSEEYTIFKKCEHIYELSNEKVRILKKFSADF